MVSEIPSTSINTDRVRSALGFDADTVYLEEVNRGFSSAEKYIVFDKDTNIPTGLAKFVRASSSQEDHQVMEAEIKNYELLSGLSLTGTIFPKVQTTIETSECKGIVIDYFDNASWGGPWNIQTVLAAESMLATLHSTQLSSEAVSQLTHTQSSLDTLVSVNTLYEKGGKAFHTPTQIVNSRNIKIYQAPDDALFHQLFTAERGELIKDSLILQDANLQNFCITPDQKVHLVDPVYLRIGDPYQDKVNFARDLIMSTSLDEDTHRYLTEHFFPQDPTNQLILDSIAYGLYASQLAYESSNTTWMDYQQKGLIALIDFWYNLKQKDL